MAVQLSPAQYQMLEDLRKTGKVKCTNRNRKTYKKLMDWGLVNYDDLYESVVLTKLGKEVKL